MGARYHFTILPLTPTFTLPLHNHLSTFTMSQLSRVYGATNVNETKALYDEWAASYDKEMAKEDQDYVGPVLAAAHVLKHLGTPSIQADIEILDAGCGTGLAGIALAQLGAQKVDAADLSTQLVHKDNTYDAICCVGTLTQGHVGPVALDEFVRITKPNGFVVSTILGSIYESG